MAGFTADWLALREAADHASRSARVADVAAQQLPRADGTVLDLAAGTGSNLRYLVERLPRTRDWLLADHDAILLAASVDRMAEWARARGYQVIATGQEIRLDRDGTSVRVQRLCEDLSRLDDRLFVGRSLVTASALLDLVSDAWLEALAGRCRASGAAALFALTYDGRIEVTPREPLDEEVRSLVNRHQQTDKGFGPALGPGAVASAARCFAARGYEVIRARSDWILSRDHRDLQRELVEGWAAAAIEMDPTRARLIDDWQTTRLKHVEAGRSEMVVGHEDLAAWL